MSSSDLQDIVNIKGHCYPVESINNYIGDRYSRGLKIVDPLNPGYRLTNEDLENIYSIMKRRDPNYKPPSYSRHEYPGFTFSYIPSGEFYHLYIDTGNSTVNLGYIPANVEATDTGSTNLTSAVLLHNLERLWDLGAILNFDGENYSCCRLPLRQNKRYWLDENDHIDIDKFVDFARIVEDQL